MLIKAKYGYVNSKLVERWYINATDIVAKMVSGESNVIRQCADRQDVEMQFNRLIKTLMDEELRK